MTHLLHGELNIANMCEIVISQNLKQKQKDNPKNICFNIPERLTEEPDLLSNVVTCDES